MAFRQSAVVTSFDLESGRVNLKQAAIFFDQIHVVEDPTAKVSGLPLLIGDDYDFLVEEGLLSPSYWRDEAKDGQLLGRQATNAFALGLFSSQEDRLAFDEFGRSALVRLAAARLSVADSTRIYVPIAQSSNYRKNPEIVAKYEAEIDRSPTERTQATIWTFDHVPAPADSTPWEDIIGYRNDSATADYFVRLRHWIQSYSNATDGTELADSLRCDLKELEQRLKLHKMQSTVVRLEATLPFLDVLGNILTLKFGELGRPLVSVAKAEIELRSVELELQCDPLYVIADIKRRFPVAAS